MQTSQPSLEIQTTDQQLLFLGNNHPLLEKTIHFFQAKNLQILHAPLNGKKSPFKNTTTIKLGNLLPFLADNTPDYFFLLLDQEFLTWYQAPQHQKLTQQVFSQLSSSRKFNFFTQKNSLAELNFLGKNILINQVFGPKIGEEHLVQRALFQALTQKAIKLPGDGLQKLHPLYLEDAFNQLTEILLNPYLSQENIQLLSSESSSYLNLAYKIRSLLSQKTTLQFEPESSQDLQSFVPSFELISWQPKLNLEKGLKKTLNWYQKNPPKKLKRAPELKPTASDPQPTTNDPEPTTKPPLISRLKPLKKRPSKPEKSSLFVKKPKPKKPLKNLFKKPKSPKKSSKIKLVFISVFLGLIFYILTLLASSLTLYFGSKRLLSELKNSGKTSTLVKKASTSSTFFLRANLNVLLQTPLTSPDLVKTEKLLHSFSLFLDSTSLLEELAILGRDITHHTFGTKEQDITALSQKAQQKTSNLYERLSYLAGLLPETLPRFTKPKHQEKYTTLKQDLQAYRTTLLATKNLLSVWPSLTGVGESKKYALLLQNNMELRPTGGFIGSYAIAEFEQGELFNFNIHDVYDADGQLKGHVNPPEPIEDYLGEANWYLRDSNWNPDFPTSASKTAWFFKKTINQEFDGIIALNLYTIKSILSVTGPIQLPDYEEKVNADNLFEKAEYHAEVNFFPGSKQKKEFLSSVADVLFLRLQEISSDKLPDLAKAIYSSLSQNHTLISLKDSRLSSTFKALGWDGSLKAPECPTINQQKSCTQGYLYVVDANLGVNKSNFFLQKEADLTSTIQKQGKIINDLTLTYQNNSTSNSWPAGDYVNYLRIYLPLSASLKSVKIGQKEIPTKDLSIKQKADKIEIGFLAEVPIKSTKKISIKYQDQSLENQSPLYSIYWQKQPGTKPYPLNITLNYPLYLSPRVISPQAQLAPQQINFSLSNIQDRRVVVQFQNN